MTLTTERANPLRQWNPDWGGMFHSSATGRRREQTLPETLGLRQARHPRDNTAGSAASEARTTRSAVAHRTSIASPARMHGPNRQPLSDRSHHCHHGGRSGWRSSYAACVSAACSSRRELMSSLVKILRRCHSTVRAARNSLAPISGLVRPSHDSRAIRASYAVKVVTVSTLRLRTVLPGCAVASVGNPVPKAIRSCMRCAASRHDRAMLAG